MLGFMVEDNVLGFQLTCGVMFAAIQGWIWPICGIMLAVYALQCSTIDIFCQLNVCLFRLSYLNIYAVRL